MSKRSTSSGLYRCTILLTTTEIVRDNNFNLQSLVHIFGMKNMHEKKFKTKLFWGQGLKMILCLYYSLAVSDILQTEVFTRNIY